MKSQQTCAGLSIIPDWIPCSNARALSTCTCSTLQQSAHEPGEAIEKSCALPAVQISWHWAHCARAPRPRCCLRAGGAACPSWCARGLGLAMSVINLICNRSGIESKMSCALARLRWAVDLRSAPGRAEACGRHGHEPSEENIRVDIKSSA